MKNNNLPFINFAASFVFALIIFLSPISTNASSQWTVKTSSGNSSGTSTPIFIFSTPISTSTPYHSSKTSCYNIASDLRIGSVGPEVTSLQKWLIENNYSIENYVEPPSFGGYFGYSTYVALKKYQQDNNIPEDGMVGPQTRANMNASCVVPLIIYDFDLTSPSSWGGDIFEKNGRPIVISWNLSTTTNISSIRATLIDSASDNKVAVIRDTISPYVKSINFIPSENIVPGSYKILLEVIKGNGEVLISRKSGAFSLIFTPTTTDATISFLSPTEGAIYKKGQTVPIEWQSENPEALRVIMYLITPFGIHVAPIASNKNGTGSMNWPIHPRVPPGEYKIRAFFTDRDMKKLPPFFDSTFTFSIVKPDIVPE